MYAPPADYAALDVFSEEDKAKAEGDSKNPSNSIEKGRRLMSPMAGRRNNGMERASGEMWARVSRTVNQMTQTLERLGFITRQRGMPRSIRLVDATDCVVCGVTRHLKPKTQAT